MARLRASDGREIELAATHRVGRHPDAELRLDDGAGVVSRFHALLAWSGAGWTVRDLGSRNGTVVDGVRLVPGEERGLGTGATLHFGGPAQAWTLTDASPPEAAAVAGDRRVTARSGVLALPDDRHLVRLDPHLGWVLDDGAAPRPVEDGATVPIDGVTWTLHLPGGLPPTAAAALPPAELSVHLDVADDRVLVRILDRGEARTLRARAHNRLLLVLAQERLRARRRADPPDEAGWVTLPDVAAYLGVTTNVAQVWWFRLREQLEAAGLPADRAPIERRFTGELRLADVPVNIQGE